MDADEGKMTLQPPSLSTLAAAVAFVSLIFYLSTVLINKTPLPPGPYGLPLLGNVGVLSQRNNWFQFSKWSKEYGEKSALTDTRCLTGVIMRNSR
jgi:hypothetical protein